MLQGYKVVTNIKAWQMLTGFCFCEWRVVKPSLMDCIERSKKYKQRKQLDLGILLAKTLTAG